MSRNPRAARKSQDKPPATAGDRRPRQVLAWRTCLVCDWEGQVVETGDADAMCPRCHALTELVAMAPVPAGGAPEEEDAAPSLKRGELAHHHARVRRAKQRKR
jgi:hypothetical protein